MKCQLAFAQGDVAFGDPVDTVSELAVVIHAIPENSIAAVLRYRYVDPGVMAKLFSD